ncbi:hypothetical protein [Spiroplasma endosymbiont of Amphibalanus improvisus]|uniref:hypothetical protein n=1 Tax=Spiroplasma endosymbiont of Amphibalanus improvisus TaxID=3066327 RepID=UPI00313A8EF5
MKNYSQNLKEEFSETISKSTFTLIKAICISLVAFLYGFFCVLAYWDPIGNAYKLPIAIVNNDSGKMVDDVLKLLITDPIDNTIEIKNADIDVKAKYITNYQQDDIDNYWNQIIIPETYSSDLGNIFKAFDQVLLNPNVPETKIVLKDSILVVLGKTFNNLSTLPTGVDNFGLQDNYDYSQHMITLQSSYEPNFINGEFMLVFDNLKSALAIQLIPNLVTGIIFDSGIKLTSEDIQKYNLDPHNNYASDSEIDLIEQILEGIKNIIDNPELDNFFDSLISDFKSIDSHLWNNPILILDNGEKIISQAQMNQNMGEFISINILPANPGSFISVDITGVENSNYGIGLGEFFLLIAIWVSALIQTFIFKREYLSKNKLNYYASFFSKYSLFLGMSFLQTTFLMIGVLSIGFSYLGTTFFLYYLWMMFATFIISTIVFSLWMTFSEENIGKFVAVIYMIFNLCAGWGTFPSFMQSGFFNFISYICPFKYIIHGEGSILYDVFYFGHSNIATQLLFSLLSILLLFVIVLLPISVFASKKRMFYKDFGTYKKQQIYLAIKDENLEELIIDDKLNIKQKFIGKIDYKNMNDEQINLIQQKISKDKEEKTNDKKF